MTPKPPCPYPETIPCAFGRSASNPKYDTWMEGYVARAKEEVETSQEAIAEWVADGDRQGYAKAGAEVEELGKVLKLCRTHILHHHRAEATDCDECFTMLATIKAALEGDS